MNDIQKYLELLELPPGANWEDVTRAYRDLIKIWHPDRFANDERLRERAEQKAKLLNEAVRQLRRHDRRTQLYRRNEINKAAGAPSEKTARDPSWRKPENSKVFQAPLQQRYRPRTTSSAVYQAISRRHRRVSRLTHLAAFSIFLISLALFGTIGLPSGRNPFGSRAATTPALRDISDYRIVELHTPSNSAQNPAPGAALNTTAPPAAWAPEERPLLIEAAANCKVPAIQELLRKGNKVNGTDANGDTALAWAARTNCAAGAKVLLQAGASPYTVAKNGFTPRDWALRAKNTPVLKLLEGY